MTKDKKYHDGYEYRNVINWNDPKLSGCGQVNPNQIVTKATIGGGGMVFGETTNYNKVRQFHQVFKLPDYDSSKSAKLLDEDRMELRIGLIAEELQELRDAIEANDLIEIADALGDLAYVVYGMAIEYNIELDDVVKEIHRSNLSKLDENNKPIYREDGKVLKSKLFTPPDLSFVLNAKNET